MNRVLETILKLLTNIVPLVEVKRRAVAEALDQCHGKFLLLLVYWLSGKPRYIDWRARANLSPPNTATVMT